MLKLLEDSNITNGHSYGNQYHTIKQNTVAPRSKSNNAVLDFLNSISTELTWLAAGALLVVCIYRLAQQRRITNTVIRYIDQCCELFGKDQSPLDVQLEGFWAQKWLEYKKTLVVFEDNPDSPEFWATQDPSSFFSVSDVQAAAGLNLRAMSSFPATLTGLGITFTFVGLVLGVSAAGATLSSEMGNESPDLLKMIEPLLSGAGVAFITSLAGLFLSLVYSWQAQLNTNKVYKSVSAWNNKLRTQWPQINQSAIIHQGQKGQTSLLSELIELTADGQTAQTDLLREMRNSIADDLAKAMVLALDQIREDRRQSDHTMVDEFSRCLKAMSIDFNSSIRTMVGQFHETVRDMAGQEIDRFAGQLKELHTEYVNANEKLVSANSSMLDQVTSHTDTTLQNAKQISQDMNTCSSEIMKFTNDLYVRFAELQKGMQQWVFTTLEDSYGVIHSDLVAAGYSLKENAREAGELLVSNAETAGDKLVLATGVVDKGYQDIAEGFKSTFVQSSNYFKDEMEGAGESIKRVGIEFSDRLAQTSDALNQSQEKVYQEGMTLLKGVFDEASHSIQAAGSGIGNMLVETSEVFSRTQEDMRKQSSELLQDVLKGAGESFSEQIRGAGATAMEQISQSVEGIGAEQKIWTERHEKAVEQLLVGVDKTATNINEAGQNVFGAWSDNVNRASVALVAAAEESGHVVQSIKPILDVQRDADSLITRAEIGYCI